MSTAPDQPTTYPRSAHDWPASECVGFTECRCDKCRAAKRLAVLRYYGEAPTD